MGTRHQHQEDMELRARKAQREFENQEAWNSKTKYYEHWEEQNQKYSNWTSDSYYQHSIHQFGEEKEKKLKEERLNIRRDKLRKLLHEDDIEFGLEQLESPRSIRSPRPEKVSTEVLKDINIGLKLAEEEKRKYEAELKLYHQWRNDNPIIREHESNHERANLKLAWLDQQIEKRMAQEQSEHLTKKLLEDRERLLNEEEQIEKLEREQEARKEKMLLEQIEENMKAFKINSNIKEELIYEDNKVQEKHLYFQEILERRQKDLEKRRNKELELFNINQSKMKLRKRALEIEEELHNEKLLIEDLQRLEIAEILETQEEKQKSIEAIRLYLNLIKDQQKLEEERQKYISLIFDSEAKLMWQRQQKIWDKEQESRDKLLNNVLTGLKKQIEEKIEHNHHQICRLEQEKQETLRRAEEYDMEIKEEKERLRRRKYERKMELDKQINEEKLFEMEEEMKEQERKKREIERVKKEEERLRNELLQMQRGKYHPSRYQRATHFW